METYLTIQRIVTQTLKSSFLPSRIASLHGILYIMQGCVLGNTVIGGLSEEMQLFVPIAIQYIKCNISIKNRYKHKVNISPSTLDNNTLQSFKSIPRTSSTAMEFIILFN